MKTSKEKSEKAVFEKIKDNLENNGIQKSESEISSLAKISVDESELNIKSLEEIFRGFYYEINVDHFEQETEVVDNLSSLLKFKHKTNEARKPPHIMLISPPCLNKRPRGGHTL